MVMERYHGEEVQVMADFLLKCDRFFDCLNSRSLTEHIQKRKADLAPYRDLQDDRFEVTAFNMNRLKLYRLEMTLLNGFLIWFLSQKLLF